MAHASSKVGIISCSGEEIAEGTIARQAVRRVLERLRPQQTVTLCLPLFLAGEVGERRFASEHPTITVDGCDRLCAKRGTEQYSGNVSASLVVTEILGGRALGCHRSTRDADGSDERAIWSVAERIAQEVDNLMSDGEAVVGSEETPAGGARCSCGGPSPNGTLVMNGKPVSINILPLIFEHLRKRGLPPGDDCSDKLLETVKVYHAVEPSEEPAYREALLLAYQEFCERNTNGQLIGLDTNRC